MMTVDDVWALLRREVQRRPLRCARLADSVGGILRDDVRAPEDQPPFDRSAVDGFVVRAGDEADVFPVTGEVRAGHPAGGGPEPGAAWRIATGAAVPEGGEVVMLEDAVQEDGPVRFLRRGRDHVRRRGEDARTGEVVVPEGSFLSAGTIGLLASVGKVEVEITRSPEILHVATGDEIVAADAELTGRQVRDSNSPLVAAWARRRDLAVRSLRVGEEPAALRRAIEGSRDLLLVSGGASVGRYDGTEDVLAAAGFDILLTKVAVRPGKPLIVARRGDEWAFGLPGNPLSHFVCLHVFVEAAVAAMRGGAWEPRCRRAVLRQPIKGNPRETWWPAVEDAEGLRPLRWSSSGDLTTLAAADALVRVPSCGLVVGAEAEFIRTT